MSNTDRCVCEDMASADLGVGVAWRFALVLRIFVALHNIRKRIRLGSSWPRLTRRAGRDEAHIRADILIVFLTALELPSWNLYTALNRVLTGAKADLGARKMSVSASLPADPVSADLMHKSMKQPRDPRAEPAVSELSVRAYRSYLTDSSET